VYTSDFATNTLVQKKKDEYLVQGRNEFEIPVATFALLDATFGVDSLCLTESTGPVRCFDLPLGLEIWRYVPPKDQHVLRVWYREADLHFYGVLWCYRSGGPRRLVRFDKQSGIPTEVVAFNSWEEEVCRALDCLVTSSGEILSLADGKPLGRLGFPERIYSLEE
jgi:hypothetical protein